MPVNRNNIVTLVNSAWRDAISARDDGVNTDDGKVHRTLSERWVDSLGKCFQENYENEDHRVFWKRNECNQEHFGLNEFLFDVLVCSVSTTLSRQRSPIDLEFIAKCHWQVESEFDKGNSRKIIVDMSKLVAGSAENKLMIASRRDEDTEKGILEQCSAIAACCSGNVYFCFVSHPEDWRTNEKLGPPDLYEWAAGVWASLNSG
ncbi:hypothetical protein [Candidatus Rariloculus sp.]|uniref:hypothetical protein n=1 Tax=Candidatus Rariloculus sp. TaxID=3101265 RepID=UPI003D0F2D39